MDGATAELNDSQVLQKDMGVEEGREELKGRTKKWDSRVGVCPLSATVVRSGWVGELQAVFT